MLSEAEICGSVIERAREPVVGNCRVNEEVSTSRCGGMVENCRLVEVGVAW